MKEYKITYELFEWPYYISFRFNADIMADDENLAIEKLKKELKNNGHRLHRVIDVEVK